MLQQYFIDFSMMENNFHEVWGGFCEDFQENNQQRFKFDKTFFVFQDVRRMDSEEMISNSG